MYMCTCKDSNYLCMSKVFHSFFACFHCIVGVLQIFYMAFILFGEARQLNTSFYIGIALVILSVVLQSLNAVRGSRRR